MSDPDNCCTGPYKSIYPFAMKGGGGLTTCSNNFWTISEVLWNFMLSIHVYVLCASLVNQLSGREGVVGSKHNI